MKSKKRNAEQQNRVAAIISGNIAKAKIISGIDNGLLAIRMGVCTKTLERRMKNPLDFTVQELMDIASATDRTLMDILGD